MKHCLLFFIFSFYNFGQQLDEDAKSKAAQLVDLLLDLQKDNLVAKKAFSKNGALAIRSFRDVHFYDGNEFVISQSPQYFQTNENSLELLKLNDLKSFSEKHKILYGLLTSSDLKNFNLEKYRTLSILYDWFTNNAQKSAVDFLVRLANEHQVLDSLGEFIDHLILNTKTVLREQFNHPKDFDVIFLDGHYKVILSQNYLGGCEYPHIVKSGRGLEKIICCLKSNYFPNVCKKHQCLISLEFIPRDYKVFEQNLTRICIRDLDGKLKYASTFQVNNFLISRDQNCIFSLSHDRQEIYKIYIKNGCWHKFKFNFNVHSFEVVNDKKLLILPEANRNTVYLVDYTNAKLSKIIVSGNWLAFDSRGKYGAYQSYMREKKDKECNLTIVNLETKHELDLTADFCKTTPGSKVSFVSDIEGVLLKLESGVKVLNPSNGKNIFEIEGKVGEYYENNGFLILENSSSRLKKLKIDSQEIDFSGDQRERGHFFDEFIIFNLKNKWFVRIKNCNSSIYLEKMFSFSKENTFAVCLDDALEVIQNGKSFYKVSGDFFYPKLSDDCKSIFVMKKEGSVYRLVKLTIYNIKEFATLKGYDHLTYHDTHPFEVIKIDISASKSDISAKI